MSPIEEQLRRWIAAGVVDPATAEAIRAFEGREAATDRVRVSMQEVIAYAGAALALAGGALLVALHREAFGLGGRLVLYVAVGAAALMGALRLAAGGAAGGRAAAACVMVAILGGGLAAGDCAASLGWLSVHHLEYAGPYAPMYDNVDRGGDAALGFGVVAVLALVAVLQLGGPLLTVLLVAGAYGATWCGLSAGRAGATVGALATCVPGAALLAVSLVTRMRAVERELLRFWGTAVPAVVLCLPGDAAAAVCTPLALAASGGALVASVRLNCNALAVAGGLGLFAVVVDVGVRWFSGPLGLPLVLIGAGMALIGVAALIQRIVSGNRRTLPAA
ncbi:MAG TPA: hypothetical protein VH134_01275 [Candidatus Dormibacteraeota bacterium]|nr:hypothetical protein [Candidatus Dormibacteraeota bacterium]